MQALKMNANESTAALDHDSIIDLILNDRIDIDSVAEFESLLEVFPKDPGLYRKFGDLLSAKNRLGRGAAGLQQGGHVVP